MEFFVMFKYDCVDGFNVKVFVKCVIGNLPKSRGYHMECNGLKYLNSFSSWWFGITLYL